MPISINDNIRLNAAKPIDARYGKTEHGHWRPFTSADEANEAIPQSVRYVGLTIYIQEDNNVREYWYNAGIEDGDLIPKEIEIIEDLDDELVLDTSKNDVFYVTLAKNMNVPAPIGGFKGQRMRVKFKQNHVGNFYVIWNDIYKFSSTYPKQPLSKSPFWSDYFEFEFDAHSGEWDCVNYSLGLH